MNYHSQFPSIRRYLCDNGATPHIRSHNNFTQYNSCNLHSDASFNLLPKSVFFTIDGYKCRCFQSPCQNFLLESWRYLNGVLNGQFKRVIGKGGEGSVLEGVWCGMRVAYKFVEITNQKLTIDYEESMSELRRRINESIQHNGTQSHSVVPFYAHYRF